MDDPSLPSKACRFLSRELTMHFRVPSYDPSRHPEWPGEERDVSFPLDSGSLLSRLRFIVIRKRGNTEAVIILMEFHGAADSDEGRKAAVAEAVSHVKAPPVGASTVVFIAYDKDYANIGCTYEQLVSAFRARGLKNLTDGEVLDGSRHKPHSKKVFVMARTTEGAFEPDLELRCSFRPCLTAEDVRRRVFEVEGPAFGSTSYGKESYYRSYVTEGFVSSFDGTKAVDRGRNDWIHLICFAPFESRRTRSSAPAVSDHVLPVGCASVLLEPEEHAGSPQFAMVFGVGVLEAYRGKGYARRMVDACVEYAGTNGADVLLLSADEDVSPLYLKCGFSIAMKEQRWGI
ncbi:hypothetical protein DFJ74DRAFT_680334 [Hyaloraphidium curvatum]|nr:hypothetical protein DFJ74DRAFT_680334 [Hyaloraphidium curvatum]